MGSNLKATLCSPDLSDEKLIKQVNELASQQAELSTKMASEHQKVVEVNKCKLPRKRKKPKLRVHRWKQIRFSITQNAATHPGTFYAHWR